MADRMAGFPIDGRVVHRAIPATGDFAFRSGVPPGNGPEPDRGVAAKISRPAVCRCYPVNSRTDRGDRHDSCVCDSAGNQTIPGADAKCACGVAECHPSQSTAV